MNGFFSLSSWLLGLAWLAAKAHLKPSSYHLLEIAWRIHVEPLWGARAVGPITPSEVPDWGRRPDTAAQRDGRDPSYGVLTGVLGRAVDDGRLPLSPARNVSLPRRGKKHRSSLTHGQVDHLAKEAGEHRTPVLLLACTGLRWGEAVALRVESVDFLRERLLVRADAVNVAGGIILSRRRATTHAASRSLTSSPRTRPSRRSSRSTTSGIPRRASRSRPTRT